MFEIYTIQENNTLDNLKHFQTTLIVLTQSLRLFLILIYIFTMLLIQLFLK